MRNDFAAWRKQKMPSIVINTKETHARQHLRVSLNLIIINFIRIRDAARQDR